ncbi:reverse transcriptase domain-containing protein [Thalassovita mangrovi]|uniref:RNA-directed DNA polymerase n=1 Tax=Thalassovita mangrovi TaxID=2692236 RepID=A0A6L8LIW1_9RHOB|nr:reverse transcriptase domain-containing protein [Thalassovita mangrovi]MYM55805.1 RNA-directed DNA polymerase [Thalassovita mangrovi]
MSLLSDNFEFGGKIGIAEREAVEKYAQRLIDKGLPVIFSPEHLSHITNIRLEALYAMSNSQESYYRSFDIPKKSGGRRRIDAPLPSLAFLQRWTLDNILNSVPLHASAKAYRKGNSIFDNARFHRKQRVVLKVDVKNFFGSIEEHSAFLIFKGLGYSKRLSKLLSMTASLHGSLPQGAPTSGALANIYMKTFDDAVFNACKESKVRYTRYADDLTFSGSDFDTDAQIRLVDKQLSKIGLSVNARKTRVLLPHVRQDVTGLVVNEKISVPQDYRRRLRQECYFIQKFGIHGHAREVNAANPRVRLEEVIGMLSYVKSIHKNEPYWSDAHSRMLEIRASFF